MPRVNVYLDDDHAELLSVLQTDGVQPSKLMQRSIEQEVEKYGYEYVPAQIIKRPAQIIKRTADST